MFRFGFQLVELRKMEGSEIFFDNRNQSPVQYNYINRVFFFFLAVRNSAGFRLISRDRATRFRVIIMTSEILNADVWWQRKIRARQHEPCSSTRVVYHFATVSSALLFQTIPYFTSCETGNNRGRFARAKTLYIKYCTLRR